MFKSKKRLFCFLIAVILVITASTSAFAASPNETKYNNTVMASSSASISDSGLLTVVNQFQGIRGKTTKGEITTYVEKKRLAFSGHEWILGNQIISGTTSYIITCTTVSIHSS